jgi:hypothetical protein
MAKIFGKRNLRYGFVSVCITIVVIAVIILFNAVLTALFEKYPLDIDLTEDRIFEISDRTREILAALDQDVDIYVLNTESSFITGSPAEYFVQANEVISRYAQYSPRVRLEYVDLIRNPDFPSRFPGLDAGINDIVVASGNRTRKLSPQDLFNIETSYYGSFITSSKAEQAMTGALLAAASKNISLAAVIGGHGEPDVRAFTDLLRMNAWDVAAVNTLTEPIPPEAGLVILAAPERDLAVEELESIDRFLEGGGSRIFFYLSSLGQPDQLAESGLPNLEAFLTEWGLAVDPGIVFETNNTRIPGNSPYLFFADFMGDDYSKRTVDRGLSPVLFQSRPLHLVYDAQRYRKTSVLIRSSSTAGIRPADASLEWTPSPQDLKADIPLLALSTSTRNSVDGGIVSAHVLACGSISAWNPSILGNANYANSSYFLDLLGRLAGQEDRIYIEDKTLGSSSLNITFAQVIILALIFIVLVPLAVLVSGIVVWLRRRHR